LSQHSDDGPGGHGGSFEQSDRLAPVVGSRPGLGTARRTPAHGRVGEPGRTRCASTGRRCVSRSAHPLAFFFFVDVEEEEEGVALAEALAVGAGLGAMAVAPLAVNP
jgi:hypothetical protein